MSDVRERLTRLIELASENAPEKQAALAFELCDLLVDWPPRYPQIMREPFEALLEKVLRRLDETTRRLIATRLSQNSETAVALLNECYLDVPAKARSMILERNQTPGDDEPSRVDLEAEARLIAAARQMGPIEFTHQFAEFFGVSPMMAQSILEDVSGDALAVACKGIGMRRVTYSTLVVFAAGRTGAGADAIYDRLAVFDAIPETGARRMLGHWRKEAAASRAA
ncbi:MAG TPA: DUF2336 domain-containing protein [Rhizomicrobium sp.]|nr:DUF2336 domain-containing protein [Rhizomicrobium sp.]